MILTLPYPDIGAVAFQIGPLAIRWYALAYIAGLVLGWKYAVFLASRSPFPITREQVDDFLVWATIGVVLGGRLGYVLFSKPLDYLRDPLEIFAVWHGGMSFHGGALGVIAAIFLFAWRRAIPALAFGDIICCATPIGLFFGRVANFINAELYGRATDVPWAMIFPSDRLGLPRHPSQLYEAGLEGLVLFAVLAFLYLRTDLPRRAGAISGVFLIGYAVARSICEFFREPDSFLGFLAFGFTTMGQVLSLPLALAGLLLLLRARPKPA